MNDLEIETMQRAINELERTVANMDFIFNELFNSFNKRLYEIEAFFQKERIEKQIALHRHAYDL